MNLSDEPKYPDAPGYKIAGPSQEVAESMASKAAVWRQKVHALLLAEELTAHEVAARFGVPNTTTHPRISELRNQGLVADTGKRRPNLGSKKSATVWKGMGVYPIVVGSALPVGGHKDA